MSSVKKEEMEENIRVFSHLYRKVPNPKLRALQYA